jgi:two-component system chemotaxis response regulator CheY
MTKTCLVVDDSRVVRMVARRILEANKFNVTEAENGERALQTCRESMPDAILLDWNMPVMDGITFLQNLRAEFGPDNPIVIFCTTESEMQFVQAAIEAGAQEYIMKPFDEEIVMGKFAQVGLA